LFMCHRGALIVKCLFCCSKMLPLDSKLSVIITITVIVTVAVTVTKT